MIESIIFNKKLFAIILRSKFKKKGINFFTETKNSFQLGYINYNTNHKISPHYHPRKKKIIFDTSEILFIKKGKIKINFYNEKTMKKYFRSRILNKGDIILIVSGGHGFKVLSNVEMIEVKQGPYDFKKTKIRLKK